MIPYSFTQLVFFFIVYCFIGWIIESTWVSAHQKKFVNRGFMRGPVIPIYGSGAMMLLLASSPFLKYPWAVFIAGMIGCSVLEYFTGAAMEAIFKVRYWDYSDKKFNLNGHICLFTSVCWGILSLAENYFIHKPIAALSVLIPEKVLSAITILLSVVFIVDLTLAFKAAFDLRALIIRMEKAKEELRLMQKRLDVMLAYVNEDMEERRAHNREAIDDWSDSVENKLEQMSDKFESGIDNLTDNIAETFTKIKSKMEAIPEELSTNMKEELYELRAKFGLHKGRKSEKGFFEDFYKRGIFLGNPSLKSTKFTETVEDLKKLMEKMREEKH
ncbi:MAG: hypothetical protein MJ107_03065 [Lachnospiraceae bacterium]|nr:hypothetical protein [Lachnospiraceae bacterium]